MSFRRTPFPTTPTEPNTDPRTLRGWWIPDAAFAAFRIAVALLLLWHGVQELFGQLLLPGQKWIGPLTPMTDPWIATALKIAGSALLALGLFTRSAALVLAVLVALAHLATNGTRVHWMLNGGELVTLYCVVLLAFAAIGPGLFSMDMLRWRRGTLRPRTSSSGMTVPISPWVRRQVRRGELTRR